MVHPPASQLKARIWLGALLLAAALGAAYARTLGVPLLLDDIGSIGENASIRSLWPLWPVLDPPAEYCTAGRPLLSLSFALNYAVGGRAVFGYHLVNLLIHLGATWLLFGLVRRLLAARRTPAGPHFHAEPLAGGIALLWALHPLHTGTVTYLSQRAESLMGLCYLATGYCLVRAASSVRHARAWQGLSVLACWLGMTAKEPMVTAPFLIFVFDWALVAGSLAEIRRRRTGYHAGLAASWLLLAALMATSDLGSRGVGAGFGGLTPGQYLAIETGVVADYLALVLWPASLVFDYGPDGWLALAFPSGRTGLVLAAVLAGAITLWRRGSRHWWFIAGYFVLLSPTSSVVPVALQPMAESRLYLPSIMVVAPLVLFAHRLVGRRVVGLLVAGALAGGALTFLRNETYRDPAALWRDTVAQRPGNSRAHAQLALHLAGAPGRSAEAEQHYLAALRLNPTDLPTQINYANLLARLPGRRPDAIARHEAVLQAVPDQALAHNGLGLLLAEIPGREADAIRHYEAALRSNPADAAVHNNLGLLLAKMPGRETDAVRHFESARHSDPHFAAPHNNLANLLVRLPGQAAAAIRHYESALRLDPAYAAAHINLGLLLAATPGREPEAERHFRAALTLEPMHPETHYNLANLLSAAPARHQEAIAHYETALRLAPAHAAAHNNYGLLLLRQPGQQAAAMSRFEAAVRSDPALPDAHYNLGVMLAGVPGRRADALVHITTALRLRPGFPAAQDALRQLQPPPE
ncbi:MAG: tetratricopeptide repeat protein [Verrucomicrobia bacterium]|nr:tetratricopeptide repeat protein [Verrucomicrobiota bacterium]